jgi:hypothetical protein
MAAKGTKKKESRVETDAYSFHFTILLLLSINSTYLARHMRTGVLCAIVVQYTVYLN